MINLLLRVHQDSRQFFDACEKRDDGKPGPCSTLQTTVSVLVDNTVVPLTTTNSAASKAVGFAQVSIASAEYGWVQLGGKPRVLVAANCQPSVPLFTTATAGVLDDATVTAGLIAGLVATTSTVTASNVTCIAGYPHVLTGLNA